MRRTLIIPPGDRTRIIRRRSGSIPRTFRITVTRHDGSGLPPEGVVEIHGSRWLFRKPPIQVPLEAELSVHKGFWDTLFSVYVTPAQRITVEIR